jgi:hypothetical protein
MFEIGDVVFIDDKIHKHYTITEFYTSVSQKACVYIKPVDGIIPDDYNGFKLISRCVCGVLCERLSYFTSISPDWEV